jgi:hypothetical protein
MTRFSGTHARFAAELLEDCRAHFLRLSTVLDDYIERFGKSDSAIVAAVAPTAPQNRANLIAAAGYAQWISDHIRHQEARWGRADKSASAYYLHPGSLPGDSDRLALLERELVTTVDGVVPPVEPPAWPGDLESIAALPASYVARLDEAKELFDHALWAVSMSTTEAMATLSGHIGALLRWLDRG